MSLNKNKKRKKRKKNFFFAVKYVTVLKMVWGVCDPVGCLLFGTLG